MEENTIILKAKGQLVDDTARHWLSKLDTRMVTLNDRSKSHTLEIMELKRRIKELEKNSK